MISVVDKRIPWKAFLGSWIVALGVILALAEFRGAPLAYEPEVGKWVEPRVSVSTHTLLANKKGTLTVRAVGPAGDTTDAMASVSIPDLNYHKEIAVAELFNGVQLDINPKDAGSACVNVISPTFAASIPLFTAIKATAADSQSRVWQLTVGDAELGALGQFSVPLQVRSQTMHNGALVAIVADKEYLFTVKDSSTNSELGSLTVPQGESTSIESIWVPLTPDHAQTVIATSRSGDSINPCRISWDSNGPRLSITALPPKPETYATFRTRASVSIYFAYKGHLIPSPYNTSVIAATPSAVTINPPSPVPIALAANVTRLDLLSTAYDRKDGKVIFTEPRSGTVATVEYSFITPWSYYAIALLCGPLGALLAAGQKLTEMSAARIGLCVFLGAIGGIVVYMGALAGCSIINVAADVVVGLPSAVLLGFAGGASGDLALAVARWFGGAK